LPQAEPVAGREAFSDRTAWTARWTSASTPSTWRGTG